MNKTVPSLILMTLLLAACGKEQAPAPGATDRKSVV